jgi:hypothetical protein
MRRLIGREDRLIPGQRELWFSFVVLEVFKVKVYRVSKER